MTDILGDAIKEAYASAPSDIVIYDTMELIHPNFVDDEGNKTSIRVVRGNEDITATLEADAPVNKGEAVKFIGYPFDFKRPAVTERAGPTMTVTIDNVSKEIGRNIERAVSSMEVIRMIYRPYTSDDLTSPQYNPPLEMTLTDIEVSVFKVSGTARFANLANRKFPYAVYTPQEFPGAVE